MRRRREPVRVAFDAAPLGAGGKGVARYLVDLLPRLGPALDGLEVVVLVPDGVELPAGSELLGRRTIRPRPAIVWEQVRLPRAVAAAGCSLLHTLTDRLPAIGAPPAVVCLFEDPAYRVGAALAGAGLKQRIADSLTTSLYPQTLRRAALILASSESTRRDVLARGVPPERVRVVYPGVDRSFRPAAGEAELAAIRARVGFPDGLVLHFSSDDPRDNTRVALESYAAAVERRPAAPPLVVLGAVSAALAEQRRLAAELGVGDRVRWLGYQSEDSLRDLYRAATVYLDPSLYEGFGFQVAEALASGAPVVCSDTTSLPEVVGDAGLLVPATDVRGFADALAGLLEQPGRLAELRGQGPRQAARFDWARTAEATVEAWRDVLGQAGGPVPGLTSRR